MRNRETWFENSSGGLKRTSERWRQRERESIRRTGVEMEEEKTKFPQHVTIRSSELPLVKFFFFPFFLRSGYDIGQIEFIQVFGLHQILNFFFLFFSFFFFLGFHCKETGFFFFFQITEITKKILVLVQVLLFLILNKSVGLSEYKIECCIDI